MDDRECSSTGCEFCTDLCPYKGQEEPELQTVVRNGVPHLCDGTGHVGFEDDDEIDDLEPDVEEFGFQIRTADRINN